MTIDAAWSTYAKQTRAAIRGGVQLTLVLLAVTGLAYWRWGNGPWIKGLLIVTAFLAVMTALEFLASRLSKRRAETDEATLQTTVVPNDDFERVADPDGEWWLERRVVTDGQPLVLRVGTEISTERFKRIKLFAATLLANPAETMKKFELFKAREAARMPEYSDEIKRLEIDCILLGTQASEVYFTPESGGEPWSAGYKDNDFCNLRLGT